MNTKESDHEHLRQVIYVVGSKGRFQCGQRHRNRLAARLQLQSAYFWSCGYHSKGRRANTKPRASRQFGVGNRRSIVLENYRCVEFLGRLWGYTGFKSMVFIRCGSRVILAIVFLSILIVALCPLTITVTITVPFTFHSQHPVKLLQIFLL